MLFLKINFLYLHHFRVGDSTNCHQGDSLAEVDKRFKKKDYEDYPSVESR